MATQKTEDSLEKYNELSDYKDALNEAAIIALTDQKGIIKEVNSNFCKLSKYSEGELIGQDHRIINSGYHPKEFISDLWETIAKGKIWKGEIKNKAKDGTFYWVDTTIVPFLDGEGKPYRYLAIRIDITERKKYEEKLTVANKELAFQNDEKEKRAVELSIANKELAFQNKEKEKRAAELIIANKELAFQNKEKEKRAVELSIANKELAFQNNEKEKRAAELNIANIELAFQNDEKKKTFSRERKTCSRVNNC
jgi:PAS domain S-box-containing protein